MLQDFEAGKPLELDCLTGAVIEIADLVGVPVPQTRAIDAAVRLKARIRDVEAGAVLAETNGRRTG
jgi:2-dehydropantoate 2-reductase